MTVDPVSEMATFVESLTYRAIPDDVVDFVEQRFVDTVGVMVAGRTKEPARTVRDLSTVGDERSDGSQLQLTEHGFVLGVTGHCLDFDDSTHSTHAHLSTTIVPTVLAVSATRPVDGAEAIVGYVSGFETAYYLAQLIMDDHYQQGWHGTSTVGTFASTATAAWLLDLDEARVEHAMNMAASMPAGLRSNFGSMTKPLHAGLAVRSGLTAALLASNDVTASDRAMTGEFGFFDVYAKSSSWHDADSSPLGREWGARREGANTKIYPCCHETHAGIEATVSLVETNEVAPADIAAVDVITSEFVAGNLPYEDPSTPAEAKFSMHYVIACAIVDSGVSHERFTDEGSHDKSLREMQERITLTAAPDLPYEYETTVRITLDDGRQYETTREKPPGINEPVTDDIIAEKFARCTRSLAPADQEQLYDVLTTLRDRPDISSILDYCYGVPPGDA